MSDLNQKQLALAGAMILFLYWCIVAMLPLVIMDGLPQQDPAACLMFLAFIGYFIFTGVRAYRRRWKARFILRLVVPGVLFCISWIAIGVLAWRQS